jgi:endonuclease/exonuclease/phosphatase family metal-dependent hydrolase
MVRLICYNIEYCEGMVGKWYQYLYFWRNLFPPKGLDQRIVESLKTLKPDILALLETDIGSPRAEKDEVKYFKRKLHMRSFADMVKYPFHGLLWPLKYMPILNKQANALISRYKFTDVKYHFLHNGMKRLVIEATVHCPKKVTLLLAHLSLGTKTRDEQIKELVGIVNSIKNPVILMGDFNTLRGEKEIATLLRHTHLKDSFKLHPNSEKFTFPAWHPNRRLDYVLVSKEINVSRYEVLKYEFSDHLPLFVEFTVD